MSTTNELFSIQCSNDLIDDDIFHHWQTQTALMTEDNYKLRLQIENITRDRERDEDIITTLRHVSYRLFFI